MIIKQEYEGQEQTIVFSLYDDIIKPPRGVEIQFLNYKLEEKIPNTIDNLVNYVLPLAKSCTTKEIVFSREEMLQIHLILDSDEKLLNTSSRTLRYLHGYKEFKLMDTNIYNTYGDTTIISLKVKGCN